MWEGDCGILPIVDPSNKVVGVITDRDICMAVATKFRPAAQISAREVSSDKLFTCRPEDDVKRALEIMRTETVRRLPVVDSEGKLQGILSLNDLALAARRGELARTGGVTNDDLVLTMQAICAHQGSEPKAERALLPAPARISTAVLAAK
jgi:CBS domain-containing protein